MVRRQECRRSGGGFQPPVQPEWLPDISRGLSVSDTPRNAVETEPHPGGVQEIFLCLSCSQAGGLPDISRGARSASDDSPGTHPRHEMTLGRAAQLHVPATVLAPPPGTVA